MPWVHEQQHINWWFICTTNATLNRPHNQHNFKFYTYRFWNIVRTVKRNELKPKNESKNKKITKIYSPMKTVVRLKNSWFLFNWMLNYTTLRRHKGILTTIQLRMIPKYSNFAIYFRTLFKFLLKYPFWVQKYAFIVLVLTEF